MLDYEVKRFLQPGAQGRVNTGRLALSREPPGRSAGCGGVDDRPQPHATATVAQSATSDARRPTIGRSSAPSRCGSDEKR